MDGNVINPLAREGLLIKALFTLVNSQQRMSAVFDDILVFSQRTKKRKTQERQQQKDSRQK